MIEEIEEKIVRYGEFEKALKFFTDVMRSELPTTIILRGDNGSGKKTLIQEAQRESGVTCIYMVPYSYADDYMAIKKIAIKLGLKPKTTISDLLSDIRKEASKKKKLVIVLIDFEEFAKKRQCLLYNLTNLIHADPLALAKNHQIPNVCLIGLTNCLDAAEHLEKRVRSRLNAKSYDLSPPYKNAKEYVEFASHLVGDEGIGGDLVYQLENLYNMGHRSIRSLKGALIDACSRDSKGTFSLDYSADTQSQNDMEVKRECISWLTRPQFDLLKMIVSYCSEKKDYMFTLQELSMMATNKMIKNFDSTNSLVLKNTASLLKIRLLKPVKMDQDIGQETQLYLGISPIQFKTICKL